MKNKDKLITVIDKIAKAESKSPETVVAELNNMTEEEILNKINNMELFREGGKLDYLLYLKKGGCAGKKVKKCQEGGEPTPTRREARQLADVNMGMNGRQFRQAYRNAKSALRDGNPELSRAEVRDAARRSFNTPIMGDEYMAKGMPISAVMPAYLPEASINVNPQVPAGAVAQLSDPSQMNDQLSFNRAFGRARKMGLNQFGWRGNDYTTELATPKPGVIRQIIDANNRVNATNQQVINDLRSQGGAKALQAAAIESMTGPASWLH